MNCKIVQDLLPSYIDHTCSKETKQIIEEHIEGCCECRDLLNSIKEIDKYDEKYIINEKKVFQKVKRKNRKNILIVCFICFLIILLFGTRLNCQLVKWRLENYVKIHYSDNYYITEFGYDDPESEGFGKDNAYYYAVFSLVDNEDSDQKFCVYTDGFFFKILDTYQIDIEERGKTLERIEKEYMEDVRTTLKKQMHELFIDCSVGYVIHSQEDNDAKKRLELDIKYDRSIDQRLPLDLTLTLYVQEKDLNNFIHYVQNVMNILNKNNFHPPYISLVLETEKGSYLVDIDNTQSLDEQELSLEIIDD